MAAFPLFRQFQRRLQQLLRVRGQSPEDAEDLIQDAFLRLEMYYRSGRQVREPEAFLVRTAIRLSMNAKRSFQRRAKAEGAAAELPQFQIAPAPDETLAMEESLAAIDDQLSRVPESTRDVFLLHRLDGYSYSQIAKLYGMTNKAVERRIARAMMAVYRGQQDAIREARNSK